jgi:hypothetical protein
MSRMLTFGLMASTMLSLTAPALAEPARERGEGRSEARRSQAQQPGADAPPSGRFERRGGGDPAQRPQAGQPAAPPSSAVATTRVPPSSANGDWRRMPGATARPAMPMRPDAAVQGGRRNPDSQVRAPDASLPQRAARRDWSGTGTAGSDARRTGNWNRNDDNERRAAAPDVRDERRTRTDNRDRTDRAGNDDRRRSDWQRDERWRDNARRDDDRARNGNDWSRQRDWSYQRRLNERDRWSSVDRWDNRWRSDRRYDWQRHRMQHRYIYRMPTYSAPYGWSYGYRRFSIGIYLSNVLFSSSYWIDDPYEYRLPPAYGPLRWVRYYDDALLIDIRDGYVVDVIHGFFW